MLCYHTTNRYGESEFGSYKSDKIARWYQHDDQVSYGRCRYHIGDIKKHGWDEDYFARHGKSGCRPFAIKATCERYPSFHQDINIVSLLALAK